jgi:hypothetical protein
MPVKIINIMLDEGEYAYAMSKKGSRTWKAIFLDGVEFKAYSPVRVAPAAGIVPTKLGAFVPRHGVRKHKAGSGPTK